MWDFLLELGREYGLAVIVIGLSFAGMAAIIVALWKRTHDQAKLIEEGGAAPKLDAVSKGLEEVVEALAGQTAELTSMKEALGGLPAIEELLEAKHEARITNLEAQISKLLEEIRELERTWREQSTADLREMLEASAANRESVRQMVAAMSDVKDLLRR